MPASCPVSAGRVPGVHVVPKSDVVITNGLPAASRPNAAHRFPFAQDMACGASRPAGTSTVCHIAPASVVTKPTALATAAHEVVVGHETCAASVVEIGAMVCASQCWPSVVAKTNGVFP